ncbi:hypothetical protein NDU88_006721 [Pleurodeles waltl]|uniref:Uncharacterized protein n=1 Tax=Pleurodeles waltl TaxID=8319 RepID=A0AAV7WFA6_PLEWA|nr:hypothetical protein NDU88_006721 [Pleurodeles waltl]
MILSRPQSSVASLSPASCNSSQDISLVPNRWLLRALDYCHGNLEVSSWAAQYLDLLIKVSRDELEMLLLLVPDCQARPGMGVDSFCLVV